MSTKQHYIYIVHSKVHVSTRVVSEHMQMPLLETQHKYLLSGIHSTDRYLHIWLNNRRYIIEVAYYPSQGVQTFITQALGMLPSISPLFQNLFLSSAPRSTNDDTISYDTVYLAYQI